MDAIRLSVGLGLACLLTATPVVAQKATPKPPKPQISATTREKAAEEHANPDALVLADFQKRVDAYMAVHRDAKKGAPPQKETKDAAKIKAAQEALGAKIRAARATAKAGDILTPEIQNKFRRLMYPVVQGPAAQGTSGSAKAVKADVKDQLKENTEERKEEGKPYKGEQRLSFEFEGFIRPGYDSEVRVHFHRRAHLPIVLASGLLNTAIPIPWWKGYSLRMSA